MCISFRTNQTLNNTGFVKDAQTAIKTDNIVSLNASNTDFKADLDGALKSGQGKIF